LIRTEEPSPQIVRRSVRVNGRQVSYLTGGDPERDATILLIHGSGVSARCWIEQVRGLAKALRVLALDLPGHGESDPVPGSTVEAYADAVADFLAALRAGRVLVAGHSLGGAVALALADRRPQVVGGLVLLSSCAKLPETDTWTKHLFSYLPGPLRRIVFFTTARRILFAPGASDRAIDIGMKELVACRAETIRRDLEAAKVMDLVAQARRVGVPTLIMCGSRDQITPPPLSERLHGLIRGSRLSIIEGSGHMVILESPERVNRDILDFVAGLGVPGRAPASWRAPETPRWSVVRRLLDLARPLFRRSRAEK
jgi:pimeloyl-ACP methyl ester carboxylesterase